MPQPYVLVVDDHPLVCAALQLAIKAASAEVVVEVADCIAAMEKAARPDRPFRLVVLDLILPDAQGFSGLLAAQRAFPDASVVVVSAREDARTIGLAAAFGAAGYITKATPLAAMRDAFRILLAGGSVFPEGTTEPESDEPRRLGRLAAGLSPAQRRILVAVADGRPSKVVAHELGLTEATVKAHLTHLFRVFGVGNRSQLILAARPLLDLQPEEGAEPSPATAQP